jgi:hypothetical protein
MTRTPDKPVVEAAKTIVSWAVVIPTVIVVGLILLAVAPSLITQAFHPGSNVSWIIIIAGCVYYYRKHQQAKRIPEQAADLTPAADPYIGALEHRASMGDESAIRSLECRDEARRRTLAEIEGA